MNKDIGGNTVNDETRLVLFQVAAFLKIVFVDRLLSAEQARGEAAELSDKIGNLLRDEGTSVA